MQKTLLEVQKLLWLPFTNPCGPFDFPSISNNTVTLWHSVHLANISLLEFFLNLINSFLGRQTDRANHRCKLTVCNMMAAVDYNGKCDNENETSNDCGQITFTECNLFHHVQQWLSPHKLIRIMWDQTNNRQLKRCDKIITHQCHRAAACHFKRSLALWPQDETQTGTICLVSESPQKDQIRSDHLWDLQFHIMFLHCNVVMWRKLCFCSEVWLFRRRPRSIHPNNTYCPQLWMAARFKKFSCGGFKLLVLETTRCCLSASIIFITYKIWSDKIRLHRSAGRLDAVAEQEETCPLCTKLQNKHRNKRKKWERWHMKQIYIRIGLDLYKKYSKWRTKQKFPISSCTTHTCTHQAAPQRFSDTQRRRAYRYVGASFICFEMIFALLCTEFFRVQCPCAVDLSSCDPLWSFLCPFSAFITDSYWEKMQHRIAVEIRLQFHMCFRYFCLMFLFVAVHMKTTLIGDECIFSLLPFLNHVV